MTVSLGSGLDRLLTLQWHLVEVVREHQRAGNLISGKDVEKAAVTQISRWILGIANGLQNNDPEFSGNDLPEAILGALEAEMAEGFQIKENGLVRVHFSYAMAKDVMDAMVRAKRELDDQAHKARRTA